MIKSDYPIYLASKSPRRRKLLKLLVPEIHVFDVETAEAFVEHESPLKTVKRIAAEKMDAAVHKINKGIIITADTVVVLENQIIGKPKDESDAFRILKMLSNKEHLVYTGLCVQIMPQNKRITTFEKTRVRFRELSDSEIYEYIASGSPMDKAGAYGIQDDYGAVFVKKIIGCYYNVVGLPLTKTFSVLHEILSYAV